MKYTCLVCDDVRPIRGPLQANAFKHAFFESLFETGTAKLSKKRKAEGEASVETTLNHAGNAPDPVNFFTCYYDYYYL